MAKDSQPARWGDQFPPARRFCANQNCGRKLNLHSTLWKSEMEGLAWCSPECWKASH